MCWPSFQPLSDGCHHQRHLKSPPRMNAVQHASFSLSAWNDIGVTLQVDLAFEQWLSCGVQRKASTRKPKLLSKCCVQTTKNIWGFQRKQSAWTFSEYQDQLLRLHWQKATSCRRSCPALAKMLQGSVGPQVLGPGTWSRLRA